LSPAETAEIVSRLDSKGIPYKLNFSGSSVLVGKSQWNDARVVAGDIATITSDQSWDEGMLGDPSLSRFRMYHRREDALARTIRRMAGVSNATVHIAVAERSPFISEQQPVTASVVLELAGGTSFSREQAESIVALVAGSVEGLQRDSVSVMDTRGRMLSVTGGYGEGEVGTHFEFRRRLESELAAKADVLLSQMLGEGRCMVRVSADLDFTSLQRTETIYDPNLKVRTQEEIVSFQKTSMDRSVGGPAGAESNLGSGSGGFNQSAPNKETEETTKTFYENASTVDIVKHAPGKIQRLTVAVMADLTEVATPNPAAQPSAGNPPPDSPISKEGIAAIVKQAVGFDAKRGDQIEVLITKFATPVLADDPLVAAKQWDFVNSILRNASLGIASIVALVLGMMTLKRMRPITIQLDGGGGDEDERAELLASLSQRIQQNPKAMQTILSAWLNESDRAEPGNDRSQAA
jgi:flagellar M-ring protein FliF